ncbi:hypothetical protein FA15DRAFT_666470 [Coprinopsis marcescibilis]|uniref:B-related factor 1 n=1 Tax=Coprinopsis marcescibilis TaxID=230819 RepID=A0A5C3L309_COPMA|nr:hypothetical protein FA15DRAFT_666470 [Coprinopsis marcescibilis]
MPCSECGGHTVWDDTAASEICTACGTLTDPTQVVLTSNDYSHGHSDFWQPTPPATLKNPRNSWALAGQGQEARDRKNAYTMGNFIISLAVSMNASGLSPRAITLFNQAKAIGYFRWGRRAKVVAGACLSIALRESYRPDSIADISTLLQCSPNLLSRTFISVTSALQIATNSVDPSVFMVTLQGFVTSILQGHQVAQSCGLPATLLKILQPLSLHTVTQTATSLCNVLARICPIDGQSRPSAASTACAVFLLSLEAEARTPLASLGDFAKTLGARLNLGKGVVMAQYKSIQDQVSSLIEKVPWLARYESHRGRAKVAKRTVVARGLKDVIKFNEEIFHNILLPDVELELTPPEASDDDNLNDDGTEATFSTSSRPHKRRKIHHSLDEATRFLLNPLHTHAASRPHRSAPASGSTFSLASYVLSTSALYNISRNPPNRLQLLAAERGGSDEAAIPDEELFTEGELESLLRNDKEAAILQRALGWDRESEEEDTVPKEEVVKSKRRRNAQGRQGQHHETEHLVKKSRLNMDALARFMGQGSESTSDNADEDNGEIDFDDEGALGLLGLGGDFDEEDLEEEGGAWLGDELYQHEDLTSTSMPNAISTHSPSLSQQGDDEEIVLDSWRPPSPSGGGGISFHNRYEEDPG